MHKLLERRDYSTFIFKWFARLSASGRIISIRCGIRDFIRVSNAWRVGFKSRDRGVDVEKHFTGGNALVIGIANYPRVRKLSEVVLKDAKDIAAMLASANYCGYDPAKITLLLDGQATAHGIRHGLRQLAGATGPEDTAVIFFSGHGGRVRNSPDTGTYLIPFDCDPSRLEKTAIGNKELTGLISDIKAGKVVVLLDACHAAGAGELKALDPADQIKAGLDEKTYNALASGAGRVIMASSRSDEFSLILEDLPNSLFTYCLLEALKGETADRGEDVVRVFDVFQYISDNVPVARRRSKRLSTRSSKPGTSKATLPSPSGSA